MAAVIRLQNSIVRRLIPAVNKRYISTSKKNSDTATVGAETKTTVATNDKNWVSYGFDRKSQSEDRRNMHATFFAAITVCVVFGGFFLLYVPDHNLRDWSQREAFLELRRREKLGLPLVNPNLIDPRKIILPSDEELGDQEIII